MYARISFSSKDVRQRFYNTGCNLIKYEASVFEELGYSLSFSRINGIKIHGFHMYNGESSYNTNFLLLLSFGCDRWLKLEVIFCLHFH